MAFDGEPFREEGEDGALRPGYAELFGALAGVDLAELTARINRHLAERNVTFGSRPFIIDPIPGLITFAEWEQLIVREPSGRFLVLEDNVRTPSGFEYALAARAALAEHLPSGCPVPRPVDPITGELLVRVMQAAVPDGRSDPTIVMLTDGPSNLAYSEHSRAAARIGVPLVTLDQLEPKGDELYAELENGESRRVDALYRRCDEDRVRDERGELTEVARAVLGPWLSGNLGLVNAFGNGFADDKLVHGYVDDFVRFYLGQEPSVPSVPTHDFERSADGQETKDRLREHVVKPRHGHGGTGVVIGPQATGPEIEELAGEVARQPQSYISQPTISLSSHPTVIDDHLEPRHVDLRVFAFSAAQIAFMPGGLSRVALEKGKLIVNSSQSGGGKDTWIL